MENIKEEASQSINLKKYKLAEREIFEKYDNIVKMS